MRILYPERKTKPVQKWVSQFSREIWWKIFGKNIGSEVYVQVMEGFIKGASRERYF